MSAVNEQINVGRGIIADKPATVQEALDPGLRLEIRDAEWVKRADLCSNGTHSVLVTDIPELLGNRDARFSDRRPRYRSRVDRPLLSGLIIATAWTHTRFRLKCAKETR